MEATRAAAAPARNAARAQATNGWTIRTRDGSLAAHYEHTLLITRDEPALLTA